VLLSGHWRPTASLIREMRSLKHNTKN